MSLVLFFGNLKTVEPDRVITPGRANFSIKGGRPFNVISFDIPDATRLGNLDALDAIFRRQDTGRINGAWQPDSGGTTVSGGTGPGTNSAGPYVHSESSSSLDPDIPLTSTLTALPKVMSSWVGNGRVLFLRASIQGNGTYPNDGASGLQIQGRVTNNDVWTTIDLLEGWAYSNSLTPGDTVMDSLGVTKTIVQAGGWVDFKTTIPDTYRQLRLRNIPASTGVNYRHDVALWYIALRDGVIPPVVLNQNIETSNLVINGERPISNIIVEDTVIFTEDANLIIEGSNPNIGIVLLGTPETASMNIVSQVPASKLSIELGVGNLTLNGQTPFSTISIEDAEIEVGTANIMISGQAPGTGLTSISMVEEANLSLVGIAPISNVGVKLETATLNIIGQNPFSTLDYTPDTSELLILGRTPFSTVSIEDVVLEPGSVNMILDSSNPINLIIIEDTITEPDSALLFLEGRTPINTGLVFLDIPTTANITLHGQEPLDHDIITKTIKHHGKSANILEPLEARV